MSIKLEPQLDPTLMGYVPPEYEHLITADPYRPGPARARLVGFERPIWGIIQEMIMYGDIDDPLQASDELIERTAKDFVVSVEAVRASLAYYALNRGAIDAKIAANAAVGANRGE